MRSVTRRKRKKQLQSITLEPGQVEALKRLRAQTRIPKADLVREAIDDLLTKHGMLWMHQKAASGRGRSAKVAKPK